MSSLLRNACHIVASIVLGLLALMLLMTWGLILILILVVSYLVITIAWVSIYKWILNYINKRKVVTK